MKIFLSALLVLPLIGCGLSPKDSDMNLVDGPENLDGKKFCRIVISDGLFGQPAGERQHCVTFSKGKMTDNASTFFGNPPSTAIYRIVDGKVQISKDGKWQTEYKYASGKLLTGVGPILTLTADLEGKTFCRTVVSDGLFGQPAGERSHCVSFTNGQMTDDASTFFGNPPETLYYRVNGSKVQVSRDGEWTTEYSVVGKTLQTEAGGVLKLKTK